MSTEAFAYLTRERGGAAALRLPCNPSAEGQREELLQKPHQCKGGTCCLPGSPHHVGLDGDALLLPAIKNAPGARQAAPSLISEGISIDSLSKSTLLTENISHKSQVTGL